MNFDEWWSKIGSGIRPLPGEDQEEHAKRVARSAWYSYCLPERLSRDQAEPLCELEGLCKETGECYGDCDCSEGVQETWRELRNRL